MALISLCLLAKLSRREGAFVTFCGCGTIRDVAGSRWSSSLQYRGFEVIRSCCRLRTGLQSLHVRVTIHFPFQLMTISCSGCLNTVCNYAVTNMQMFEEVFKASDCSDCECVLHSRDLYPVLVKRLQAGNRPCASSEAVLFLELDRIRALLVLLTQVTQTAGCHEELQRGLVKWDSTFMIW